MICEKPCLDGKQAQIGLAGQVELVVDVTQVCLDRFFAKIETGGDLGVL
jgi:hypothetical protein